VEEVPGWWTTNSCMNVDRESMLAISGPASMAQSVIEVARNSVETSRGGV
jgi:hypothetical protein